MAVLSAQAGPVVELEQRNLTDGTLRKEPRLATLASQDVIEGNHDAFLLEPELVQTYSNLPIITAAVDWCRGELPSWAIDFVRTFVAGMDLDLGGGATLKLFHGTPRSHMEDMLATTPTSVQCGKPQSIARTHSRR